MSLKLSRLAYEVVRDSIVMPNNTELTYDDFIKRSDDYFSANSDWSLQFRMVFPAINVAIARLVTYNKLPYFTVEKRLQTLKDYKQSTNSQELVGCMDYLVKMADLSNLEYRRIINAVIPKVNGWVNCDFRIEGKKLILKGFINAPAILLEYQKKIPIFDKKSIVASEVTDDGTEYVDTNIDLEDYGFDEVAYTFVKCYAESEIMKELDPAQANNMLMLAENYFSDMEQRLPNYNQRAIKRVI